MEQRLGLQWCKKWPIYCLQLGVLILLARTGYQPLYDAIQSFKHDSLEGMTTNVQNKRVQRLFKGGLMLYKLQFSSNGILNGDIYNFDETGFAMGLTSTARVITQSEYYGWRSVLQPGNHEWVTGGINWCKWVGASTSHNLQREAISTSLV
ncbi:uncharacterized protein ASPGLDRAFT_533400 [Aspergillus glaucus CBS 516.65]|uniref:Uncharacterized protein n=1 Tax=Aspergillus glaucus CBS 516.65 TaxID=1160497 RepID=A0A1L9VEK3_ASPGL|nr:hypothetical protein ASPGLDRAFT_533400 [Aspergillus glaucus CBS 516.65]OJJ82378.1 hypothetical protein ASPGLDRAFT_533400 [Aspergillus glaucus CBS 516.65]